MEIWSQDETRVGQQGSLTRIWAKKGTRPRKVKQRQFISTYLYGAACHQTGKSYAVVLPSTNTQSMNMFLKGLSMDIPEGKHVALIVDNAGLYCPPMSRPKIGKMKGVLGSHTTASYKYFA